MSEVCLAVLPTAASRLDVEQRTKVRTLCGRSCGPDAQRSHLPARHLQTGLVAPKEGCDLSTGKAEVILAILLTPASFTKLYKKPEKLTTQQCMCTQVTCPAVSAQARPAPAERRGGCRPGLREGLAGSPQRPASLLPPAGLRRPTGPPQGGSCCGAAWQRLLPAANPPAGLQQTGEDAFSLPAAHR